MSKGGGGKRRKSRSPGRTARAEAEANEAGAGLRWRVLYRVSLVFVWLGVGLAAVLAYFAADLPSTEGLGRPEKTHAVTLLDANGRMIARRGIDSGLPVTLQDLPSFVPQA